jgi:glutathione S-transferase
MSDDDPPLLWQVAFSHFNEKARWALDFKRVPHRRRTVAPGVHVLRSKRLGGEGTLPILDIGGRRITDSKEIVAELERTHPEAPLYPADEAERRRALEFERSLAEEFGPGIRRALFHELLPETRVAARTLFQDLPAPSRVFHCALMPVTRIPVRRALGADAAGAESGRRETRAALDRIESELRPSGYLVGEQFSIADLTAAALLAPVVGPPEFNYAFPDPWPPGWDAFRSELRGRKGWAWTEEMFARHRGISAAVG